MAGDYQPALLSMVGILAVGFVCNLLVKPVSARYHEKQDAKKAATVASEQSAMAGVTDDDVKPRTSPLLYIAWIVVGIPLAYGVYETVVKAIDLFSN